MRTYPQLCFSKKRKFWFRISVLFWFLQGKGWKYSTLYPSSQLLRASKGSILQMIFQSLSKYDLNKVLLWYHISGHLITTHFCICHMQNFVVITPSRSEWEQNKILFKFKILKLVSETGLTPGHQWRDWGDSSYITNMFFNYLNNLILVANDSWQPCHPERFQNIFNILWSSDAI